MTEEPKHCFFCDSGQNIVKEKTARFTYRYKCPNCGQYEIEDTAADRYKNNDEIKFKAACIAVERKLKHREQYVILFQEAGDTVTDRPCISMERFIAEFPDTALGILDRALLNLGRMIPHPGDQIKLGPSSRFALFCKEVSQMRHVVSQFENMGYVKSFNMMHNGTFDLVFQPEGWKRIQTLTEVSGIDSNQAFVAMWFDPAKKYVYDKGIEPALKACKLKSIRIDLEEHNENIVDEILAEIKRSRCVVADFTGGRQGVYFEAGFARGLGIPVIWMVHKDHLDDLHFDTRQYNHILYENTEELRKKLENRIRATVL